jgi:hypothetical protein
MFCKYSKLIIATQINILTYIFFMMPSLGIGLEAAGYSNILGHLGHVLGGENGIFLTTWLWKGSILLFMLSRTAMPIIMAKTDKALLAKIHVIIRSVLLGFLCLKDQSGYSVLLSKQKKLLIVTMQFIRSNWPSPTFLF